MALFPGACSQPADRPSYPSASLCKNKNITRTESQGSGWGSYIFNSLELLIVVLLLCISLGSGLRNGGGGFGPTNNNRFCGGCFLGSVAELYGLTTHSIFAFRSATKITTSSIPDDAVISTPNAAKPIGILGLPVIFPGTPAAVNTSANSFANENASESPFWYSTYTSRDGAISRRSSTSCQYSSGKICRQPYLRSISAALSTAFLTSSFDRRRNSVWIFASLLANKISPTIAKAITTSAKNDPHLSRKESYDGWMPAIISSATMAAVTKPAHPHSQRLQDDDAFSNWFSVAFIMPFGKRHAGKEFRGFWVGLGIGVLIFASLFAISFSIK